MATDASYSGLNQLLSEQNKAITNTNNQIKQLENYLNDYATLKKKLAEYPASVIKKTYVPFGPKAFAPGYYRHTNELYALLGDNYFAFVSANQADKIVSKRMKKLNDDVDGLKEQNRLLNDRLSFASQLSTEVKEKETTEIREDYDSDTERTWRVQHSQKLRNSKSKQGIEASQTMSDEALMQLFEKLEVEEERAERLGLTPAIKNSADKTKNKQKQVRFSDRKQGSKCDDSDEEESTSSEPLTDDEICDFSMKPVASRIIHFRHSDNQPQSKAPFVSGNTFSNGPGDIYHQHLSSSEVHEEPSKPYSDIVIERDPHVSSNVTTSNNRPKSKFSSMRLNR